MIREKELLSTIGVLLSQAYSTVLKLEMHIMMHRVDALPEILG